MYFFVVAAPAALSLPFVVGCRHFFKRRFTRTGCEAVEISDAFLVGFPAEFGY